MQSYWCTNDDVACPRPLAFQESLTVLGKLLSDSSDIMLGQNISLTDSILLRTFELPCRALGCKHIQCFDFQSYLHVNVGRIPSAYMCPICSQVSNPSKLYVDTVTLCLAKIVASDATICLMKDGSFEVKSPAAFREVINVDDDDDEDEVVYTDSSGAGGPAVVGGVSSGSVFELSYVVPYTITNPLSSDLTSLKVLTTASLDDILHLMNVDTAWGVNSIPNITPALQKCIRDKRPYVCNTREDLNHALRAVDGVGSVRAARIVEHFYSILQSKLTNFGHMLKDRTLFKPISAPTTIGSLPAASPVLAFLLRNGALKHADAAKKPETSRIRANSVISVTSASSAGNVSATSSLLSSRQPLAQQLVRVQVAAVGTPVKPSTSLRAKGSSGICGEGIADVCRPPRMGRSASVSEVSLDVSRATSHGSATSSSSQETQAQSSSPRTSSQGASSSQAQVRSPVARAQRTPPACEVIVVDSGTEESGDESVVVVRPGRRGQVPQGNRGGESRLSSPAITSRPSVDAVLPLGERRASPAGAATLTVQSSTLQPSARLTAATAGDYGAAVSRPGDLRWAPPPPPPPRSPAMQQASVPTALSAPPPAGPMGPAPASRIPRGTVARTGVANAQSSATQSNLHTGSPARNAAACHSEECSRPRFHRSRRPCPVPQLSQRQRHNCLGLRLQRHRPRIGRHAEMCILPYVAALRTLGDLYSVC
jgi:hypothetical protein